jgi:outer membrane protein OmpA-like peptidoglycan-associated protein
MKRSASSALLILLVASFGGLACSAGPARQNAKQAPLPDAGSDHTYNPKLPLPGEYDDRYISLDLGDTAKTCAIPQTRFRFDSTAMPPDERAQLHALASCLMKPELLKTEVRLVGRADASGTVPYNEGLSARRSDRVKKILVDEGVAAARITTSARGESDAIGGTPAASPGYDRRVDIVLDGDHAPQQGPERH